jgi:hypothetical protein
VNSRRASGPGALLPNRQQTVSKRRRIFRSDARHGIAKIFEREVAVGTRRGRHGSVAEDALHAVCIDAGSQHERRGRVAQVVKAHRPWNRPGPCAPKREDSNCPCIEPQ